MGFYGIGVFNFWGKIKKISFLSFHETPRVGLSLGDCDDEALLLSSVCSPLLLLSSGRSPLLLPSSVCSQLLLRDSALDKIRFESLTLDRQEMNNEDTMNLNDTEDYMSGDELMDQNSDGDEDEAVAVEDTLMSTAETRVKR
ncbi:hypothetical protein IGI04_007333, partial [Brassica rapa subsp. trilocularis]